MVLFVKITNEKNQGCFSFGSCLITNVKNTESPKWLKDKLRPICRIYGYTNS